MGRISVPVQFLYSLRDELLSFELIANTYGREWTFPLPCGLFREGSLDTLLQEFFSDLDHAAAVHQFLVFVGHHVLKPLLRLLTIALSSRRIAG